MSATDELLRRAHAYASTFDQGGLPIVPARHLAIVTCMDARVNPYAIFGLAEGDAHIIRNAGGVVTDDVIRSLAMSQRLLGTTEIILVRHVDCGLRAKPDREFRAQVALETGVDPTWASAQLDGEVLDIERSLVELRSCPFLAHTESVRGFLYHESSGVLTEEG